MDYNQHDYNCITVIALHAIISASVQWVSAELPLNISNVGYFLFIYFFFKVKIQNLENFFHYHYQYLLKHNPLTFRHHECLHVTYMSQSSSAAAMQSRARVLVSVTRLNMLRVSEHILGTQYANVTHPCLGFALMPRQRSKHNTHRTRPQIISQQCNTETKQKNKSSSQEEKPSGETYLKKM